MPTLSEHRNTWGAVLKTLERKGFQVWREENDGEVEYWAERNGWDFLADSPLSLLGLVAHYEHLSPKAFKVDWWREGGECDSWDVPTKHQSYVPAYESEVRGSTRDK